MPLSLDARDPRPHQQRLVGEPTDAVFVWRDTVYERQVEIDTLVAGRELDLLVAERVMETGFDPYTHYSRSQSASTDLERRLETLGWTRVGRSDRPGAPDGFDVVVELRHADGGIVTGAGKAFEEALCKAALRAVEL